MSVINTNLTSLTSQQNLKKSQSSLATSLERLSSGLRVNSAKDDAAGQAIGNRMTSQIKGQAQAMRNANDGISMIQTAEGALDQINDRLQRVRELSVQGLNGIITAHDADAIQAEINQNLKEIDRIQTNTDFNSIPLLNGKTGALNLQLGANDAQTLSVDLDSRGFSVEELGLEDFTIYGLEGEIIPRKTLTESARDIELRPAANSEVTTDLSMYVQGVLQDNSMVDFVRGTGDFRARYIETQEGGKPQYYYYSRQDATHDTNTNHNEITIEANSPIFSGAEALEIPNASQQAFELSDGSSIPASNDPELKAADGRYFIHTQEEGLNVYREASVTLDDTGSDSQLTAKAKNNMAYTNTLFAAISGGDIIPVDESGTTQNRPYDDYSSVVFETSAGSAFSSGSHSLVEHDGDYYIQQDDGGTITFFTANLSSTDGDTLRVRATESVGLMQADFTAPTAVTDIPFDTSNVDFSTFGLSGGDARLLEYRFGDKGYYVEDTSGAEPTYTKVNLSMTASDTSTINVAVSQETGATPETFSPIDKIDGESLITLDQSNVEINYTEESQDGSFRTYNDVLRQDADGSYYMRLSNDSDVNSFRKVTLVDNLKSGTTLLQVSQGASEVLIYHEFSFTGETDADLDQAATGEKRTVLNITAGADEIRIKQPNNPLSVLDDAIERVDNQRSILGATHNRLESSIEGLATSRINSTAARSRIMDADYAVEVANMTRAQILQQAGTSVLAQANQIPQSVLSLLG